MLLLRCSAGPTTRRSTCVGTCIVYQVRHWMHFKKLYVNAFKHVRNTGRKRCFLSSNSSALDMPASFRRGWQFVRRGSVCRLLRSIWHKERPESLRACENSSVVGLQARSHDVRTNEGCCALFVCSGDSVVVFTCHHAVRCLPALGLFNPVFAPFLQVPSKSEVLKSNLSVSDHTHISFPVFRSGRSFCLQGRDAWIPPKKDGWSAPWNQSIQLQTIGKL